MGLSLGLQVFSIRESLQKDFWGAMEEVARIGYKNIELANHRADVDPGCGFDVPAAEFKRRMDGLGLTTISSHVSPLEKADLGAVIEYAHTIGNANIACPMHFYQDEADVLAFAKEMNGLGEKLKKGGIQLYYHNHFHEFQKFKGKVALDLLLANTDPDLVRVELDTFWALRGGVDPVAYLKKLGKRCELIHQKDLAASASPVDLFERFGQGEKLDMEAFRTKGASPSDFVEAGEGVMDIRGIVAEARRIGAAKYIIIEQDCSAHAELESVGISFKNMTKLLSAK